MASIFISDLHLEEKKPDITQAFLRFLDEACASIEHLYILGDFFEVWVGDDYQDGLTDLIISKLRAICDSGVKLHLMHGNRDFLLGEAFCEKTGATLLPDPYVLVSEQKDENILLMHGDSLCTDDVQYMAVRPLLRDKAFIADFLNKTMEERQQFARQLRNESTSANQDKTDEIMDVNEAEVIKLMEEHKVSTLLHGHTHRPKVHQVSLKDRQGQRIVMSDWDDQIFYARLDDSGLHLLRFEP